MAGGDFRDSAFVATSSNTPTVTVPGTIQDGDYGLMVIESSADIVTSTFTAPAGWTAIRALANGGSGAWGLYYRQRQSGDSNSIVWTNVDANGSPTSITVTWFSECDGFGTLGTITSRSTSTNIATAVAHGTSSDYTHSLVIITGKTSASMTVAPTDGSGPTLTKLGDAFYGSGSGHPYCAIYDYTGTPESFTATTSGSGGTGAGVQIAVINGDPPPPPDPTVDYFIPAIPSPTSLWVSAKVDNVITGAQLVVSPNSDLSSPTSTGSSVAPTSSHVHVYAEDLTADTTYHYGLLLDGTELIYGGEFSTAPTGTASFRFWFGSCQRTASDHTNFLTMLAEDAVFGVHLGDRGYQDRDTTVEADYLGDWDAAFTPNFKALIAETPLAYMFDNHDGPGGSGGWSGSTGASANFSARRKVLKEPHVVSSAVTAGGFWQMWTWGRVKFILVDPRSQRDDPSETDGAGKTMWGTAQKDWYKDELLDAEEPLIFLCYGGTWTPGGPDRWTDYATEFVEVNQYLVDNDLIGRVVVLSGDQHAVAADDGSRFDPAGITEQPVNLVGAAFDQDGAGSGTWSEGNFPNETGRGQYGCIDITDDGTTITMSFRGVRDDGVSRVTYVEEYVSEVDENITSPVATATAQMQVPTVAATQSVTIAAPVISAIAQSFTPVVSTERSAAIDAPTMLSTTEFLVPTVSAGGAVNVTAPLIEATMQAHVPTVTAERSCTVTVPVATATAAAAVPTISGTRAVNIASPVSTSTALFQVPIIVAGQIVNVSAPVMTATAQLRVPTVAAGESGATNLEFLGIMIGGDLIPGEIGTTEGGEFVPVTVELP